MIDYQSIIDGDYNAVQAALAQGASADGLGKDGLHFIHYAAMANQPKIFSLLIEHGAPINAHDYHNNTPLYYICRSGGSQSFAQYAIDHGADLNAQNKIGQAPIHIAVRIGNIDALYALLKSGADVNLKDIVGKAPLHDAIATTHPLAILPLIEYGANVNQQDNHFNSPLMLGTASTNADISNIFKLPILSELPIPLHNDLFVSVVTDNVQGLEKALSAGASVDSANSHGLTLLSYAVINGFDDVITSLLNHNVDVIHTDNLGLQPIHFASMVKDDNALEALLKHNASINAMDEKGNTPLHYACQYADSVDFVTKVLNSGALIDTQNNKGETALHIAADNGYLDVVKVLVAHHANVDLKDNEGDTALQEAINAHHQEVVSFLEQGGLHNIKPMPKLNVLELSDVISSEANDISGLKNSNQQHVPTCHHEQPQTLVVTENPVVIAPVVEHI
ncbi:MAG: ankyrin repeat domain-containing protein [Proteobacteria bacterium]|nr:ankyrin repeat domain-containing protein [Pseudomonadota bacterium]